MELTLRQRLTIWLLLFTVSLKLGLTSFGGPVAHLGYFHEAYIRRRQWMQEKEYAELVAVSQFLPGPASSQVGIGIGLMRGGIVGGIISFIGFTLPSILLMIFFASFLHLFNIGEAGWVNGLKIVAVAVVAHAILGMAQKLTPDLQTKALALFALILTLVWQTTYSQVTVILLAGLIGFIVFKQSKSNEESGSKFPISKRAGAISLTLFFLLLFALPFLRTLTSNEWLALFDSFYRSGSLVFGGGHVVLPLLEQEFVPTGWITQEEFLAGYGAAQALPGPLFTFATYIGAVIAGWPGGLFATVAIFLPAFLLIFGAIPFWDALKTNPKIRGVVDGINAAVVGILISALYQPIWTSTIQSTYDFALAATLFALLVYWKWPPWTIVLLGALGGTLIAMIG